MARVHGEKNGSRKIITSRLLLWFFTNWILFGNWESVKVPQKRNLEAVGVPTSVPVRVAHELLQAGHKYLDVR
ncbi:hypothetical protein C1H46_045879 [Malus baccata]|uniref:Rhodanese domain-containing protein n=1 Tax=Malus baccata TaxID=106549 RepID=A0A540K2T1_MALBA|nr:hypothetical protein C1H46_045879 [Malus baccata]